MEEDRHGIHTYIIIIIIAHVNKMEVEAPVHWPPIRPLSRENEQPNEINKHQNLNAQRSSIKAGSQPPIVISARVSFYQDAETSEFYSQPMSVHQLRTWIILIVFVVLLPLPKVVLLSATVCVLGAPVDNPTKTGVVQEISKYQSTSINHPPIVGPVNPDILSDVEKLEKTKHNLDEKPQVRVSPASHFHANEQSSDSYGLKINPTETSEVKRAQRDADNHDAADISQRGEIKFGSPPLKVEDKPTPAIGQVAPQQEERPTSSISQGEPHHHEFRDVTDKPAEEEEAPVSGQSFPAVHVEQQHAVNHHPDIHHPHKRDTKEVTKKEDVKSESNTKSVKLAPVHEEKPEAVADQHAHHQHKRDTKESTVNATTEVNHQSDQAAHLTCGHKHHAEDDHVQPAKRDTAETAKPTEPQINVKPLISARPAVGEKLAPVSIVPAIAAPVESAKREKRDTEPSSTTPQITTSSNIQKVSAVGGRQTLPQIPAVHDHTISESEAASEKTDVTTAKYHLAPTAVHSSFSHTWTHPGLIANKEEKTAAASDSHPVVAVATSDVKPVAAEASKENVASTSTTTTTTEGSARHRRGVDQYEAQDQPTTAKATTAWWRSINFDKEAPKEKAAAEPTTAPAKPAVAVKKVDTDQEKHKRETAEEQKPSTSTTSSSSAQQVSTTTVKYVRPAESEPVYDNVPPTFVHPVPVAQILGNKKDASA